MRLRPLICFVFPILAAGLLAWTSCRKGPETPPAGSPTGKIRLGFLVKQPEEPWFQYEWKGADKAARQYGFELVKLGVTDGEKVIMAIDNLAAQGAQGFVICPPDVRLGSAIMTKARAAGLKVIAVDDQFVSSSGQLMTEVPYLGMSARDIGRQVGQALAAEWKRRQWPAEDTALCVITFDQLDTIRQRTDGAVEAMQQAGFPADRIFRSAQKTQDVSGGFDAANILLTQHPHIKRWLICGGNDTAVLGAVRAAEGRQFAAAHVLGIGINGTDCIDELRKPTPTGFFGSIFVSAPGEGFRTSELLYRWVKDEVEPPRDTRTAGTLITRENFERILKEEGILE